MQPNDYNAYALRDTSARSPVEVKAVWEVDGKFHTLRLKGEGRVEGDTEEREHLYSESSFSPYRLAPVQRYRFIVEIEDTFTITETDEDPRLRKASTSIDKITLTAIEEAMSRKSVPADAEIEIDPFEGGNLVTFKWKEM